MELVLVLCESSKMGQGTSSSTTLLTRPVLSSVPLANTSCWATHPSQFYLPLRSTVIVTRSSIRNQRRIHAFRCSDVTQIIETASLCIYLFERRGCGVNNTGHCRNVIRGVDTHLQPLSRAGQGHGNSIHMYIRAIQTPSAVVGTQRDIQQPAGGITPTRERTRISHPSRRGKTHTSRLL